MEKQKPVTPEVVDCYCGAKAKLIDWDFNDMWQVMCDNNHTLSKQCGSKHKATILWNKRVEAKG